VRRQLDQAAAQPVPPVRGGGEVEGAVELRERRLGGAGQVVDAPPPGLEGALVGLPSVRLVRGE
jgi:hypothetical protein